VKPHFKISLIVVALATLLAIIAAVQQPSPTVIVITFGSTCCIAGLFSLVIAGILGLSRQYERAKAFLMSAGITFLLGTGVCSTLLLG